MSLIWLVFIGKAVISRTKMEEINYKLLNQQKFFHKQQLKNKKQTMPRNIMIPEEEENTPQLTIANSKDTTQRSSVNSNFSENDQMMDTRWRTNLLISEDEERVEKRDRSARKNTSFQNKIINDHIKVMVEVVCEQEGSEMAQCQEICNMIAREQCLIKENIMKEKVKEMIDYNMYLTEDEKSDFLPMFVQNFDNYQILVNTMSRLTALSQSRDELTFILMKVVEFISRNYEMKLRKYDEEFMEEQIPKRLAEVSSLITTHENVKLINPEYFYNTNEAKYVSIIEKWFYSAFAIKLGISGNKYGRRNQTQMEM